MEFAHASIGVVPCSYRYIIGAWMTTTLYTNENIVFLVQWSHVTMNVIITTH